MDDFEMFEAIRQSLIEIAQCYDRQTELLRKMVDRIEVIDNRLLVMECAALDKNIMIQKTQKQGDSQ